MTEIKNVDPDDIPYVRDIRHFPMGPWHQYDILLDAGRYGWAYSLDSADYMAGADLRCITEIKAGDLRLKVDDYTDSYHAHGDRCVDTPELKLEHGFLSIAGISDAMRAPVKIAWFNQTRALRIFTVVEDELPVRNYVEKMIRRSFRSSGSAEAGGDDPRLRIGNRSVPVSEILSGLPAEEHVDLINDLSDRLESGSVSNHERSVLLKMIDEYEHRMQSELRERSDALRKSSEKQQWKAVFLFFSNKWIEGYIREAEAWLRYVRPLIKAAAARGTENSFVNESLDCIKELASRSLYNNDHAAFEITSVLAKELADIPSAMVWVMTINRLAAGHLSRKTVSHPQ